MRIGELVSIKILDGNGEGDLADLVSAMQYVKSLDGTADAIQIVNISAGTSDWYYQEEIHDDLREAIFNYGGLVVCSAGNTNTNLNNSNRFPASIDGDNIITVGASKADDTRWIISNTKGSNYNGPVDIFAPGVDIISCVPIEICPSWCGNKYGSDSHISDGYHALTGTSMATPFVTGVAALILSVNPNIETDKLKQYILDNVDDASDDVTAFEGICESNGRLNAYKALNAALTCQHGGSNTYAQNDQMSHMVCCGNCGHNLYAEGHSLTYTNTNTINHTVSCTKCSYSFTENHERYVESVYDDGCTIACGSCSYSFDCDCTPNYRKFNSSVHLVDCPDGEFSFSEEHNFDYLWLLPSDSSRLFYHNAVCADCGGSYRLAHNWESIFGGGVECSDCGLESNIGGVGNVMSLSDEELSLLLSSMSEEELDQFIALLPEDQLARVTAILPRDDDEFLTE